MKHVSCAFSEEIVLVKTTCVLLAGLGSLELLNDKECYPIRGQVTRVRAPWIKKVFIFDGSNYVIPNKHTVVVGGTQQHGNFSEIVDDQDTKSIFDKVSGYLPSLLDAEVEYHWVRHSPYLLL